MSKEVQKKFINHYKCAQCGYEWEDEWDCACDDDCPSCGARHMQPYESDENETGQTIVWHNKNE